MVAGDEGADGEQPLDERRRRLARELDFERGRRPDPTSNEARRGSSSAFGVAFRLASEFVAAVLVGAAIGWAVDRFLGVAPWGLIVFLLLGFAAGVVNVMRESQRMATMHTGRGNGQEKD